MNSLPSKPDAQQSIELDSVLSTTFHSLISNIFLSKLHIYTDIFKTKLHLPAQECHYPEIPDSTFQSEDDSHDIAEPNAKKKTKL